jgi:carbonic anhydrase
MSLPNESRARALAGDATAGLVVFLVALPLCLGVALASNAPLMSGLLAGIVGGIIVGILSGSHSSVSGPAAGLTAVVGAQIVSLGSFETFLLAVMLAGVFQIILGISRAGFLAAFFPSSVIKGLLAAIGVILILKQIPHLFGHDPDPEGDMSFEQPDKKNTFTELIDLFQDLFRGEAEVGAMIIGIVSVFVLLSWDRIKLLKKSPIPSALVIVIFGVACSELFRSFGPHWEIGSTHLVQVEIANSLADFGTFLRHPNFSGFSNAVVFAALTLAAVASLETLLNLEAVDKIDPRQRVSPPSRELIAQGVGNVACGLIGGLPVTSVIVRSSVNINAGARSKLSAIFHGVLLLVSILLLPKLLNRIPLSCLAAILFVSGIKLASPKLMKQMWKGGLNQFIPFLTTVVAIVLTDLLIGVVIGLLVSLAFILRRNQSRPIRRVVEKHLGGDVVHIELANQVSFLNRGAFDRIFNELPEGTQLLIDATQCDYIDVDILDMIRDFTTVSAPARGIQVSLLGFKEKYDLEDHIQFVDYSTRDIQSSMTPEQVIQLLKDGHARFRSGQRLKRDLGRQITATAAGQHPLAIILSCIDSRTPVELIFDLGVGDMFSIRIAGNVTSNKVLGSLEYACVVAGAKVILVMGHTRCGAVGAAVKQTCSGNNVAQETGCEHLESIVNDIGESIEKPEFDTYTAHSDLQKQTFVDEIARRNVRRMVERIIRDSTPLAALVKEGRVAILGAMYDVATGNIEFI